MQKISSKLIGHFSCKTTYGKLKLASYMETVIFDGRAFASQREKSLTRDVLRLKRKGIVPKLVSVLVGDDPASTLYVNLKKKKGESVGIDVEILKLKSSITSEEIITKIQKLNNDEKVGGIMVQLPLPKGFSKKERDEVIDSILPEKDVDGLREKSLYLTPTVKSVLFALREASKNIVRPNQKVLVIGFTGFEGGKIYKVFEEMGYEVVGADSKTKDLNLKISKSDILISATGSPGIIKGKMVKEGSIVIDVGAPEGDVIKGDIIGKAGFLSPVPGGIGPVTIISLLENLTESAERMAKKSFKKSRD